MKGSNCSRCGQPGSGNFCQHCGAALKPGFCTQCGTPLPANSGFCEKCGARRGSSGPAAASEGGSPVGRWLVPAGVLVVAVAIALVFLVRINNGGSTVGLPPQGLAQSAAPPDLSQMTPRERFDRLYNRVMQAAETNDAATMQQFSPMALAAYGMLPEVDADARYHAALLKLHMGDVAGSAALADSILAETPDHLFGYVVKGTLAKWRNDPEALAVEYQAFLAAYDAEMAAQRAEYDHHERSIQGFLEDARSGR